MRRERRKRLALPLVPLCLRRRVKPGRIPARWLLGDRAGAVRADPVLDAYFDVLGDRPHWAPDIMSAIKEGHVKIDGDRADERARERAAAKAKRRFERVVGRTRREFGTAWWLVCVLDWLERSGERPAAMAQALEVESAAYLMRTFKKHIGKTPAKWLRMSEAARCAHLEARVRRSKRKRRESTILLLDVRSGHA